MQLIINLALIAITIIIVIAIRHKNNNQNHTNAGSTRNRNSHTNTHNQNRNQQTTGGAMTETGVMEYFANTRYNEKDVWFRFNYKKVGNEWRAYIIRMPSLRGRDGNPHLTHRYTDGHGNYWVCRSPSPTNLRDCQNVSKVWADRLLEYISTGIEANQQQW